MEFVIKVPENLMPISKNRRCALIPVEAAYSDDEQETAVAQENRQVWFLSPSQLQDACYSVTQLAPHSLGVQ